MADSLRGAHGIVGRLLGAGSDEVSNLGRQEYPEEYAKGGNKQGHRLAARLLTEALRRGLRGVPGEGALGFAGSQLAGLGVEGFEAINSAVQGVSPLNMAYAKDTLGDLAANFRGGLDALDPKRAQGAALLAGLRKGKGRKR